jgi:hypothetical protein
VSKGKYGVRLFRSGDSEAGGFYPLELPCAPAYCASGPDRADGCSTNNSPSCMRLTPQPKLGPPRHLVCGACSHAPDRNSHLGCSSRSGLRCVRSGRRGG